MGEQEDQTRYEAINAARGLRKALKDGWNEYVPVKRHQLEAVLKFLSKELEGDDG